ncbi:MAG: peptidylprolyl isomerase [Candidatus Methylomirabilales bacterium]
MVSKRAVGSPVLMLMSRGKGARRLSLYGITRWVACGAILYACISPMSVHAESPGGEKEMTVSAGNTISIEYTLRLEDKAVVDTNVGADPLTYVHGSQQIIPGLEKALEGLKIGENKQVTVTPENGYGPVIQDAFVEVKKEQIPKDALKVDAQLQGKDASGQNFQARVAEIREQTVLLDFNHPLAGRTLYFDVKILDIQKASAE